VPEADHSQRDDDLFGAGWEQLRMDRRILHHRAAYDQDNHSLEKEQHNYKNGVKGTPETIKTLLQQAPALILPDYRIEYNRKILYSSPSEENSKLVKFKLVQ